MSNLFQPAALNTQSLLKISDASLTELRRAVKAELPTFAGSNLADIIAAMLNTVAAHQGMIRRGDKPTGLPLKAQLVDISDSSPNIAPGA